MILSLTLLEARILQQNSLDAVSNWEEQMSETMDKRLKDVIQMQIDANRSILKKLSAFDLD